MAAHDPEFRTRLLSGEEFRICDSCAELRGAQRAQAGAAIVADGAKRNSATTSAYGE